MTNNIWSEIRSNFEDESIVYIDAWITPDDNEEGTVIAKVNVLTGNVQYIDDRAKTDAYAQEIIKEVLILTRAAQTRQAGQIWPAAACLRLLV